MKTELERIRDQLKCSLNMGGLKGSAEWAVGEIDRLLANLPVGVPVELLERIRDCGDAEIAVFRDDNNGPGEWMCPACEGYSNATYRDGKRQPFPGIAHADDCWLEELRALLASHAKIDAFLTSTPAPEVQACVLGGTGISASMKGALWDALMTPQPGPDVRGLVESASAYLDAIDSGAHDYDVKRARHNLRHELAAHRQAQR